MRPSTQQLLYQKYNTTRLAFNIKIYITLNGIFVQMYNIKTKLILFNYMYILEPWKWLLKVEACSDTF
jgi:hypothetical protein